MTTNKRVSGKEEYKLKFETAMAKVEKQGKTAYRNAWVGHSFIYSIPGNELSGILKYGYGEYQGEPTIQSTIAHHNEKSEISLGWEPTEEDRVATDWFIKGEKTEGKVYKHVVIQHEEPKVAMRFTDKSKDKVLWELTTGENRVNAYASWDNDKKPTIVYTNKPVNSLEKVVKLGDWLVNIAPNLWIIRDNELMEEFYMEVVVKEEEKGKWE